VKVVESGKLNRNGERGTIEWDNYGRIVFGKTGLRKKEIKLVPATKRGLELTGKGVQ